MFQGKALIKICGITSIDQALQVAELGVDAIGIISVKESPRFVKAEMKKEIFENLKKFFPKIKRVSVVKNLPLEILLNNFIDYENIIQLHGDEDIEYCKKIKSRLTNLKLWKAFRIKDKKDISKIEFFSDFVDAILLDSWNKETYGGSGIRIDQENLTGLKLKKPWFLAGGVSVDWVEHILNNIKPDGIDISSSIEISPGIKDIQKTKLLIRKIRG